MSVSCRTDVERKFGVDLADHSVRCDCGRPLDGMFICQHCEQQASDELVIEAGGIPASEFKPVNYMPPWPNAQMEREYDYWKAYLASRTPHKELHIDDLP
jgi:hypothetical protein